MHTALSLVGYDKELEAAMKFAFGSAFVAKDLNTAKKVWKQVAVFPPKVGQYFPFKILSYIQKIAGAPFWSHNIEGGEGREVSNIGKKLAKIVAEEQLWYFLLTICQFLISWTVDIISVAGGLWSTS